MALRLRVFTFLAISSIASIRRPLAWANPLPDAVPCISGQISEALGGALGREAIVAFRGESLEMLFQAAHLRRINFTTDYGPKRLMVSIAQGIGQPSARERVIREIEQLDWGFYGGSSARRGMGDLSAERIVKSLRKIVEAEPGLGINPADAHLPEAVRKLVGFAAPLDREKVAVFSKSMEPFAKTFKTQKLNFSRQYGAKKLVLGLAGRISDISRRQQVIAEIEQLPWTAQDGHATFWERSYFAAARLLFSLQKIAEAEPSFGVRPEEVHLPQPLARMMKMLDEEEWEIAVFKEKSLKILSVGARLQGVVFAGHYGARDFMLKIAGRISDPSKRSGVVKEIRQLPWGIHDGREALKNFEAPARRILFSLRKIAGAEPSLGVNPQEPLSPESIARIMRFASTVSHEKLVLLRGSLDLLAMESQARKIPLSSKNGARSLMLRIAEGIFSPLRRSQVMREIQSLPWAEEDGVKAKSTDAAAERILFSLQKIAEAEPRFGVSPAEVHLREPLERMLKQASDGTESEKITVFRNESFNLLSLAASFQGMTLSKDDSARKLMLRIAEGISSPSRRVRVIEEIERLPWKASDGSHKNITRSESPAERILFSLRKIAEAEPKFGVNPREVHLQASVARMLGFASLLNQEKLDVFRTGLRLLSKASRQQKIPFHKDNGAQAFMLKIAEKISDPSKRDQVEREIQSLLWGEWDGSRAQRDDRAAAKILFSLQKIAAAEPRFGVSPDAVHLPGRLAKMLDAVFSVEK